MVRARLLQLNAHQIPFFINLNAILYLPNVLISMKREDSAINAFVGIKLLQAFVKKLNVPKGKFLLNMMKLAEMFLLNVKSMMRYQGIASVVKIVNTL